MRGTSQDRIVMLDSQIAAISSVPVFVRGNDGVTIYLQANGTVTGGTVIIEEADYDGPEGGPYTGTWSQIFSVAANTFNGGQSAQHLTNPGAYGAVRVRISVAITGGGSVSAIMRRQ